MSTTIGVLQPGYLPSLVFYEQMHLVDHFILLDEVQFDRSWRNRNRIKTRQGWQWLTVPVHFRMRDASPLYDVSIDNSHAWQKKHRNLIVENYGKSPFYELHEDFINTLLAPDKLFLLDVVMESINYLKQALHIDTPVYSAHDYNLENKFRQEMGPDADATDRNIFIVRHFGGAVFFEGKSGINYLDIDRCAEQGVEVRFQEFIPREYEQLHPPFIPYLSALDYVMNNQHSPFCRSDDLSTEMIVSSDRGQE